MDCSILYGFEEQVLLCQRAEKLGGGELQEAVKQTKVC